MLVQSFGDNRHFYPRSPCGERLSMALDQYLNEQISIHALLAESDSGLRYTRRFYAISIHALLAESDFCLLVY